VSIPDGLKLLVPAPPKHPYEDVEKPEGTNVRPVEGTRLIDGAKLRAEGENTEVPYIPKEETPGV
jgi:hypothetical protein